MSGTVYIVDDDQGVRTGLTQALGTHGYHALTFPTADEFIARYTPGGPACLVLDLVMPGTHGLQLLDRIDPDDPIRIIVLTGYADIPTAVNAIRRGAHDFLEKPVRHESLLETIDEAMQRSADAARSQESTQDIRERYATLTAAERAILRPLIEGHSTRDIATRLHRSERTIGNHRQSILQKMHARNTTELAHLLGKVTPTESQKNN